MSVPRSPQRARWQIATLALVLAVGACGGGTDTDLADAQSVTTADGATSASPTTSGGASTATGATSPSAADATSTSNPPATTTAAPTTAATAATTTTPAMTAVIPTTVPLPVPVAPPLDAENDEPVVELGRLAIPSLGLDATLYEGIRLPTFDLGPGHWPGSALPGQVGNMIVGGHRTSSNADFADLDELEPGDQMIVNGSDGAAYTYAVDLVEITDPFATRIIGQTPARTATLFACHPPGSVDYRIVVHLTLVA